MWRREDETFFFPIFFPTSPPTLATYSQIHPIAIPEWSDPVQWSLSILGRSEKAKKKRKKKSQTPVLSQRFYIPGDLTLPLLRTGNWGPSRIDKGPPTIACSHCLALGGGGALRLRISPSWVNSSPPSHLYPRVIQERENGRVKGKEIRPSQLAATPPVSIQYFRSFT